MFSQYLWMSIDCSSMADHKKEMTREIVYLASFPFPLPCSPQETPAKLLSNFRYENTLALISENATKVFFCMNYVVDKGKCYLIDMKLLNAPTDLREWGLDFDLINLDVPSFDPETRAVGLGLRALGCSRDLVRLPTPPPTPPTPPPTPPTLQRPGVGPSCLFLCPCLRRVSQIDGSQLQF